MRNTQVAARISEVERKRLRDYADILDIPEAQIIREALKEKLERMQADPRIARWLARQRTSEVAVAFDS
jgi:predicted DNA-binding protein